LGLGATNAPDPTLTTRAAGSRWRAFSIGGLFALPAGWCFYWFIQKAECYIDLDQLALDLLTLFFS
jgi:hypothetical protein